MADTRKDYLLEIGTEELPPSFLESAEDELLTRMADALEQNRLTFNQIEMMSTPRRLSLVIRKLAPVQTSTEELIKGPPKSIALDEQGNPTKAAEGFLKKQGITMDDVEIQDIGGTEYLAYRKFSEGAPVEEILPEIIPDVVLGLSGSHFMVWDESGIKFSRPIRWIVSMLGDQHVPVKIGLTESSTASRGLRFFSEQPAIPIPSVEAYKSTLWQQGHVMVDQDERREFIANALINVAGDLKGVVPQNEALLDTVTRLVESPVLISGNFDTQFLRLPKEVITTVMAAHQKYFPVEDAQSKLMPYFITVSNNINPEAENIIREGNERVLKARLDDASFFFNEDRKHPLSHFNESLKGITFQKGLGTLYDRSERLQQLTKSLGELVQSDNTTLNHAIRAAELCKADLATQMVRELTELQGIVGRHYAQMDGEPEAVATAIEEHYLPRFTGDRVASTPAGVLLSIADKLDAMTAVFSQKDARYPTGSKDPMGLRRMAFGILHTVLENQLSLNLDEAMRLAYKSLGSLAKESEADTLERTTQFLLQRFKGYLLDQKFPYDVIDAVLECERSPFANLGNTIERLQALSELRGDTRKFMEIYESANRTARILGKSYKPDVTAKDIDPSRFEVDTESNLFKVVSQDRPYQPSLSPREAVACFSDWYWSIEAFFEKVLVNAEDPKVKENRYHLLSMLNHAFRDFADFTKLVV